MVDIFKRKLAEIENEIVGLQKIRTAIIEAMRSVDAANAVEPPTPERPRKTVAARKKMVPRKKLSPPVSNQPSTPTPTQDIALNPELQSLLKKANDGA